MYNFQEQLWFNKPDYKVKNNSFFDPLTWNVGKFVYQIAKVDFLTEEEFETYENFSSR